MRSVAVVCVLVVALGGAAGADPVSRRAFRSFGSEQGLENLSINQISQTRDGLVWLGTDDGLYRFDGAHFQRFDLAAGLPSNRIFALLPQAGDLWVGTGAGLARVSGGALISGAAPDLPAAQVDALAAAPDGTVWVATDRGLYHGGPAGFALAPGWPGGASAAVWVGADGRVVAGREAELATSIEPGAWTIAGAEAGFGRQRIQAIAQTGDGLLWVRSERFLWSCAAAAPCVDHSAELPDASEIGRLLVDPAGALWVTTTLGLAHRLGDGRWELLGADAGLPTRSVLDAFFDREGSLWLAADQLYLLVGRGLWRTYAAPHDLPADTVWAILRDARGTLWLGSNRGVLVADGDHWRTIPGTEAYAVQALIEVGDQLLAVGSDSRLMTIDPATQAIVAWLPPPGLTNAGIVTMVADHGTVWAGAMKGGLLRLDDHAWTREPLPGGDDREDVHQIVVDRAGRLWAAGSSGLAVRDGDRWRRLTPRDGLAGTPVDYLVARSSGEMCVAYTESLGMSCFRYVGPTAPLAELRHLTRATGLTSDKIYTLGEDARGRLYVGLGVGVDVVSSGWLDGGGSPPAGSAAEGRRGWIEHFSTATGLVGDDCAARAFWVDPDGDVLMGTSRGMERFAGARYAGPPATPAPVVMRAELVPGTADLAFHFATPTFANRSRLEQQTRLLPLESDWTTSPLDEARYTHLAPGDYVFEVRSRLAPGDWGAPNRVTLTVPPMWWQTLWFRGLVALAVLAMIARAVIWRARAVSARAATRSLARSEASFRALIEESPDAVFVHRGDVIVYANARAASYLGYTAVELVGVSMLAMLPAEDRDAASRQARALIATGTFAAREVQLVRRDGGLISVEVSTLEVDFGDSPALLSIARDCTARKALEARLMASDRMASIGTLAAGIAHEVNNPLAYLQANLAMIGEELGRARLPDPELTTLRSALADAVEGANRVKSIVHGVKTFSRLEAGPQQPVDIQRAVDLALRMTANELRHRCRLVTTYGPVPPVLGNESRIGQVFMNLLVNAAHALAPGPAQAHEIHVSTRTDERGQAVIEIRDTGVGMPADVVKRIFEPFFTTKDVGEGTGLGLSICHGIVQSLGGDITVESTPGAGSTFRVILPGMTAPAVPRLVTPRLAAPSAQTPAQTPAETPAQTAATPTAARHQVLVIDDDERLLASIGRMLRSHHEVALVASPVDALARLDAGERFDVILCDLMMPGFTGMALHEQLSRQLPAQAARMLFMTGGAFTAEARAFLELDGIRALEKPFDAAELRGQVNAVAACGEV